jgi:hypothetical protein
LKNIRGTDDEEWLPDGSLGRKERKRNKQTHLLVKKNLEKAKGKQRRVNNLWLSRRLVYAIYIFLANITDAVQHFNGAGFASLFGRNIQNFLKD